MASSVSALQEHDTSPGSSKLQVTILASEWGSNHLRIDVVVGHGVQLGHQAQVIRVSHKCKWVQVAHTDPEELGIFKCFENPFTRGNETVSIEIELCQVADFVVGVGPKLAEAFHKYLGNRHQDVFEFTPGVFDDFLSVQQVRDKRKKCSVLVFGCGDLEDFKLKGFDIAARSVAALSDAYLFFMGAPYGNIEEIAKHFVECGIPENRLIVRIYHSLELSKCLFFEVDLVLMPSRTEGFGLIGLEALSVGLPVLVSKNSGFGEAMLSVPFGSMYVIDSEDPSAWTAAIKSI
ncbi:D-inositol 3-phosphate glycosyltransferase-like [Acropora millepora]|uniref:D-inositol 3-phosphate glycosyltransferase-like n=1 Tax=Acropora millepora TaxID=45264 RepID=UPI001CF3477D|nr:D-inositol 3-phosphate glycosyltransferase-like [Acropora millepora]